MHGNIRFPFILCKIPSLDLSTGILLLQLIELPSKSFYDFDEYERLVEAATTEPAALLLVLLGGEAGLRCGEMMALEWDDIDVAKRQLCVARSDWKGHVAMPKGGRLRFVPLTKRLGEALARHRHLRHRRVLCVDGQPLTHCARAPRAGPA